MSKNLTFSKKLYLSDSIDYKKLDKMKKKLLYAPILSKLFLITISTNEQDQLDILESKYLTFPFYNAHPLFVVGLAKTNSEAIQLVEKMFQDCLDQKNHAKVKSFLMEGKE